MNAEESLNLARRFIELPLEKRQLFLDGLQEEGIDFSVFPIPADIDTDDRHGLSYSQQRMWFLWQLDPNSGAYNLPSAVRLTGNLNKEALERAFAALIARHETLRTVFQPQPNGGVRLAALAQPIVVEWEDRSAIPADEREQQIRHEAEQQSLQPFDLSVGPLLRIKLLQLEEQQHVLLLTLHHIVADGWSMGVLIDEFNNFYQAFNHGEQPQCTALPIQYSDYALWQRRWLEAGEAVRQLDYWRTALGAEHPILELPADRSRPARASLSGRRLEFEIAPLLAEHLRALAARHNVTPFVLLLASFQVLLHRYSGQRDIRVGVPIANRNREETERLIGLFVNTQVLQASVDGSLRFVDLLQQAKQAALGAQTHQDLPFEQLVEALQPDRSLSHGPLFQVMYNHQPHVADIAALHTESGLTLSLIEWESRTTQFDLSLDTYEKGGRLLAALTYATDLFDAQTIQRMAQHWQNVLHGIIADPTQQIGALPLLSAQEQQTQLHDWNDTQVEYPLNRCIHQLIEEQVERTPNATAVLFGETVLSYRELNSRANRLAHTLIEQGVGPDVLVGIAAERSLDMVIGLLAIVKAGGAYVPFDPSYPADRLAYMLDDSGIRLLLAQRDLQDALPFRPDIKTIFLEQDELYGADDSDPIARVHPENIAYVIYTSGSTGRPKGAANRHVALTNRLCWMQQAYALSTNDTVLQKTPFSFDVSVWEFFWPLMIGARLVVSAPDEHRDPALLIDTIRQNQVTTLHFVPSMLHAFLQDSAVASCTSLQRIICSGEALSVEIQQQVFEKLPKVNLYNLYGPTEAAIDVTHWTCRDEQRSSVPIGRPIANLHTFILDAQFEAVPIGVIGELYLGGMGLARGYHNRSGLTAERFVVNPFDADGSRLYRTGDLARFRVDGVIEYVGRIDHQVKIRGLRIELGEIEAQLRAHAQVREAVVVVQDAPSGQQLIGYVVPANKNLTDNDDTDERRLYVDTLKAALKAQLPDYMVPSHWVLLEQLPLSANGKLDRKALPPLDVSASRYVYMAPRTDVEQQIAAIWQGVLGIDKVSINDNFFELGGDSIISLQVVSRARQLGICFTPRDLFEHQTVQGLASVAVISDKAATIDQGLAQGIAPLSPIQRWFFDTEIPERQHWNQSLLLTPRVGLDAHMLDVALLKLLEHHDALRLRYVRENSGNWQQSYSAPTQESPLWRRTAESATALRVICDEAQRSLDLENGSLLRAVLIAMADGTQRLLLVIHHLAIDGVSWRILLDDLHHFYQSVRTDSAISKPLKSSAYKNWGERLQHYANSHELLQQLDYWQAQITASNDLPCTNAGGRLQHRYAHKIEARLSGALTRQLLQDVPAAYRTGINEVLLTALVRVICEWTQQASTLIQLESHGREDLFDDLDLTRSIGWFTSMFPLKLTPEVALGDAIKAVKEQLRAVPDKGIGYGVLRYLAEPEIGVQLAKLVQPRITFNYLGQFDRQFDAEALFEPALEGSGSAQSDDAPLLNWLSIEGQVYGGELSLSWTFSREMFAETTMQQVADAYMRELEALITHCSNSHNRGVTPSDFPLARLTQVQLDSLPIALGEIDDIYSLSPMQQGMLFHTLYEQEAGNYVNQLRVDVEGLDVERFRRAWQESVNAHDILRASFNWQFEHAVQIIRRHAELPFSFHDWRDQTALATHLDAVAQQEREQNFDLKQAPLLRLTLVRTQHNTYHLIYTSHHILMDGWSNSQLLSEVLQRYSGQAPAHQSHSYGDYIAWLQRQPSQLSEDFWKVQLSELQEPTHLAQALSVSKNPVLKTQGAGYGDYYHYMDAQQTSALSEFSRQQKLTVNTLIQAAWLLLLQRYTAQECVALGATVAGRPAELSGVERQIGLFINTLPVIASFKPEQLLSDCLQELQTKNLALREHEHTPLYEIQRWSGHAGQALFDTIMVFENYPIADVLRQTTALDLRFGEVINREQTNYALTLTVNLGEILSVHFNYDRSEFTESAIEQLGKNFHKLLQGFVAQPGARIGDLLLLDARTQNEILKGGDATAITYPLQRNVHELIQDQAEQTPSAIALIFADVQLTYRELNNQANRLAHRLIKLGVGPDILVGIAVERSPYMVIGLLAILKAGGAYVPLDPDYPEDRLHYMIEDSGIQLLLTQGNLQHGLSAPSQLQTLNIDQPDNYTSDATNPNCRAHLHHLAYVIYTSGSTGRPKGVAISRAALLKHTFVSRDFFALNASDRVLQFATVCFDAFIEQCFPPLCCGAAIVLRGNDLWDSRKFYAELHKHKISVVDLTTSYWFMLARDFALAGPRDYGELRQVHAGGEAMPPEGLIDWKKAGLEHIKLLNTYGPTEATVTVTALDCDDYLTGKIHKPDNMPIGKVLPGRSILILDKWGDVAATGIVGELYIGGDMLARGYHQRAGLSAERFLPNPFDENGGRLYRTGDLVRQQTNGTIEYVGRIDHQIKIRGFRIELGEIEARLQEHPAIREAVVIARQGPGGYQLVAYIVANSMSYDQKQSGYVSDQRVLIEQLKNALKAQLPDYMVPTHLLLLERLPLLPNGKLDRKSLPALDISALQQAYVAPQSDLEKQLAAIWQEVLSVERIGLADNFFELGGHSLLAINVISRVQLELGIAPNHQLIFQFPTFRDFAAQLNAVTALDAKKLDLLEEFFDELEDA